MSSGALSLLLLLVLLLVLLLIVLIRNGRQLGIKLRHDPQLGQLLHEQHRVRLELDDAFRRRWGGRVDQGCRTRALYDARRRREVGSGGSSFFFLGGCGL